MPEDTSNIIPGQYIVVYKNNKADVKSMRAGRDKVKEKGGEIKASFSSAIKGFSAKLTKDALHELRTNPDIAYIEPDQYIYAVEDEVGAQSTQDVSAAGLWGLDRIDQVENNYDGYYHYPTSAGAGVHVYVVDSGIRASHTEFGGRVSGGYDFVDDDSNPNDEFGHGTAVASVVGGSTYGVAKGVYLHAVRVLDYLGNGSISDVIAGLNWVIANRFDPAVVNMSLGDDTIMSSLNTAVANTVSAGITVVVASGNVKTDESYAACDWSPASVPSALTVGATTSSDARGSFSTYGSCLDLFAPGSNVLGADNSNDTDFAYWTGTSIASPMAAGAAALYLSDHPGASPSEVAAALIDQATDETLTDVGADSPNLLLAVFSDDVPQITLSSPADGYQTNQTTLTLAWNAGFIGNSYELQVDDSASFDSLFYTTSTESLSAAVSGLTVGTWYWRVQASNAYGTIGEWSAARSFIVDQTPPDAPVLSTPADDAHIVGTPAFAWSAPASAVYYQFDYGTSSSDPEIGQVYRSGELSAPSHTPPSMTQVTQYYWFARARDAAGNWSAWSAPFSIMIVPAAPGGPGLTSPANGAASNDDTPQLTWSQVSGAYSYNVQLSLSSTFDPLAESADDLAEANYTAGPLEDGKYYWRVRCKSIYGIYGSWSSVRNFTLDTVSPDAPALVSPISGAKVNDVPAFTWSAVTGATAYQFAYSLSDNAAAAIYLSDELTTLSHTPIVKTRNVMYYWFARARDTAGNWSAWSSSNFLTILADTPGQVVLSTPTTGALTNDDTPALAWAMLENSEYYHLQIADSTAFTNILQDEDDLTGTSFTPAALDDGIYYWRVRGRNNTADYGAWSSARYFTVDTSAPAVPTPSLPANGASVTGTPTFTWSRPSTARYYQFRYADADAPETILYTSGEITAYYLKPPAMQVMNTYNWSVRARDAAGNWSGWSAISTLTVLPPVPSKVVLTSPASAFATNQDTTPLTLEWNSVNYALSYHLQISRSSSFPAATLTDDQEGLTGLSYVPGSLTEGTYYWRVRAKNANDVYGAWSSLRYFTVDKIPPAAPSLSSPANDVQFTGTPAFQWVRPSGAVYFEFQYGATSDPGSFEYNSGLTSRNTHTPPPLQTNTEYYWYVKARDKAGNWSGWSAARTITILPPTPAKPVLSAPGNGTSGNDPTPDFGWGAVGYAASYDIQISTRTSFVAPYLYLEETDLPSAAFTPTASLPDGRYYWRVRAKNENGIAGAWSSYRYFYVDTLRPAAPLLRSPADSASVTGSPTFLWYSVTGARYYQFAYGSEDNPETALFTSDWITGTSLKVTPAEFMTSYYWFVRSKDLAGNISENWSASRRVTVLPPVPARVALASPDNASITDDSTPELTWNAVAHGHTYQIQIDDSIYFTSLNYTYTSEVEATSITTGELAAGRWYWRVRACNENDVCGSWSSSRNFTLYARFDTQFSTDGDTENWENASGADWAAASGNLATAGLTGGRTSSSSYDADNFKDFTYEANMKMDAPASGEANTYGLLLRGTPAYDTWNDWTKGIYFTIRQVNDSATGTQYACALAYKIYSGVWTYLGGSCGQAVYEDWNNLKVYANGTTFKFYVNDYLVLSKSVSGITSGRLGLVTWGQGAANTSVDWVAAGAPVEPVALSLSLSAQSALPAGLDARDVFEAMKK